MIRYVLSAASVLTLVLSISDPARAQVPADWARSKDTFRSFVQSDSIVGASALIMRDGRVLDRVDMGFADRARGARVDSTTIFPGSSRT